MGKNKKHARAAPPAPSSMEDADYHDTLHDLQVELVKLQRHAIATGARIVILLEGRDAGGKDGVIKRITEHLSPRETRVVALAKPSDREQGEWNFQRWAARLPAAGEIVLFNRSWYNRAGVERVMGFCSDKQADSFLAIVPSFEQMLIEDGIRLCKYYLDISKDEQKRRLADRASDPLKQWKISPIDAAATKMWKEYSGARNEMLARSHTLASPWTIVRSDDKRRARINLVRHLLMRLDYPDAKKKLLVPDPQIVFAYEERYLAEGWIAP